MQALQWKSGHIKRMQKDSEGMSQQEQLKVAMGTMWHVGRGAGSFDSGPWLETSGQSLAQPATHDPACPLASAPGESNIRSSHCTEQSPS